MRELAGCLWPSEAGGHNIAGSGSCEGGVVGSPMIALAFLYAGAPEEGAPLVEPLRALGPAVGDHVGVQPYSAWQQAFDPLLTAGARNYWKSHNFTELQDGLFDTVLRFAGRLPSPSARYSWRRSVVPRRGRRVADAKLVA